MSLNLTHKEKKVIHQVANNMIVQIDLNDTLANLQERGIIKPVSKSKYPKLKVIQEALDETYGGKPAVDPMRVNVNNGKLIDEDEVT